MDGKSVVIIDKLDDLLYSKKTKISRLDALKLQYSFEFHQLDLAHHKVDQIIQPYDVVIHCAALPGQVLSWDHFSSYADNNILATKNLLDSCKAKNIKNFVYSSTSSVYGKIVDGLGDSRLEPYSPYGVTKLAGENLVRCYNLNFGLPTKILRYFSVYGPGQRPDMAIQGFLECIRDNKPITVLGSGEQSRDFTYVDDCADISISAANSEQNFLISDVSGGQVANILEILEYCFEASGHKVPIQFKNRVKGDQDTTKGSPISSELDFKSSPIEIFNGIKAQWLQVKSEK